MYELSGLHGSPRKVLGKPYVALRTSCVPGDGERVAAATAHFDDIIERMHPKFT